MSSIAAKHILNLLTKTDNTSIQNNQAIVKVLENTPIVSNVKISFTKDNLFNIIHIDKEKNEILYVDHYGNEFKFDKFIHVSLIKK